MLRSILLILLLSVCDGYCDLINTQLAAKDLCGITISLIEKNSPVTGELTLSVQYDRAKVGAVLAVVIRNKEYKRIGEFEYVSQDPESESGTGQARFSLSPESLHRSYLKTEDYIIPLRLYLDEHGGKTEELASANTKATSAYSLKVWPVQLSFYKAQMGPASKKAPDSKPVFPQSKTQEDLFRSWGLAPPAGTIFYPGRGKAAIVIKSTKEFLVELESELNKRGFLAKDK